MIETLKLFPGNQNAKKDIAQLLATETDAAIVSKLEAPLRDLIDSSDLNEQCSGIAALTFILDLKFEAGQQLCQNLAPLLSQTAEQTSVPSARVQDKLDRCKFEMAVLLSTAATHASARPFLATLNADAWLEQHLVSPIPSLKLVCALAWIKLHFNKDSITYLTLFLQALQDKATASFALEGLAILTLFPNTRHELFEKRPDAIDTMLTLAKTQDVPDLAMLYSLVIIFLNLSSYKPVAMSDKERIEHMVKQKEEREDWEPSDLVDRRNAVLVEKRVVGDALSVCSRSASASTRLLAGKVLLNLTQQQRLRGSLIQQGAAVILLNIRRQGPAGDVRLLDSNQAFARLAITSNPALVIAPALFAEAIGLLSELFLSDESDMLKQFEALMALTNFASLPGQANVIASNKALMSKLDVLMLNTTAGSGNKGAQMCQQAATQLVNNLVVCEPGFAHFAQDADLDSSSTKTLGQSYQTRIHVLLALSDFEDVPDTRLAASASLAILTASPRVRSFLLSDKMRHRTIEVISNLVKDNEDTRARGMMAMSNIISSLHSFDPSVSKQVAQQWYQVLEALPANEATQLLMADLKAS